MSPQNSSNVVGPVVRLTIVMISVLAAIGMLVIESSAGSVLGHSFGTNPVDVQAR